MEKETIIELKNIRKEFPGVVALDNVNMKIRASEVHALVGENGAGKSNILKSISLLKELIDYDKNMTISEISYKVGFGTPSYFSSCFYKQYDMYPTDVRK